MKKLIPLYTLIFLLTGAPLYAQITTFILVRHAEKQIMDDRNPPLTEIGIKRAEKLVEVFSEVEIDALYSTDYIRTIQTITPLSKSKELEIRSYQPKDFDELASQLLKDHKGQTVVVSGHSNTTPRLVNSFLGANKHTDLDESEYDWVYIVDVVEIGTAKVKKLKVQVY